MARILGKSLMLIGIVFFALVARQTAADPECERIVNDGIIFNIKPEETQFLNMYRYFQGYNMQFSLRDDEESENTLDFFQNPITKAEEKDRPIVPEGSKIVSYDAWQNQDGSVNHIILIENKENNQFTVMKGSSLTIVLIPDFQQVQGFDLTQDQGKVIYDCYQAFFVQQFIVVVDCLVNDIGGSEIYSQYFTINLSKESDSTYFQRIYNYQSQVEMPKRRINIVFKDEGLGYFILSTIPFENAKTLSKINIYAFKNTQIQAYPDGELIEILKNPISSFPGETDPLYIVDIGVSEEEIYVLSLEKLFRFKFDGKQIIEITRSGIQFDDEDQGSIISFAVYQDIDELFVMMAEDNRISIYFWPPNSKDSSMQLRAIVQIDQLQNIREVKFGEDYAFLISEGDLVAFNWYEAIQSADANRQLQATINLVRVNYEQNSDVFFESFSKDYVFLVSESKHGVYFFSDPMLKLTNPKTVTQKEELMITATSIENKNGEIKQKTCSMTVYIQPILNDDGTKLFPTSLNLNLDYVPSVVEEFQRVDLEGQFDGPNIQYSAYIDATLNSSAALTSYSMMTFMPASIELSEIVKNIIFTKMWTVPNRQNKDAFYVFTQNSDYRVKADRCLVRETPNKITCLKRLYSVTNYQDTIEDMAVDLYDSKTVIAATYKNQKANQLDFFFLNGTNYASIKFNPTDLDARITDVQMINGYVFVAQKGKKNINVYDLDFKMTKGEIFSLNVDTVGHWPCFGDQDHDWSHLAVYSHRSSPNMFYVETYKCLVEIQIIGNRPHFISQYDLKSVKSDQSDRAITVTEKSIIVATVQVEQDQSITQSIFEIYNDDPIVPLYLAPIETYGFQLTFPIVSAFSYYSDSLYLLAKKVTQSSNSFYLMSVNADVPDVSRFSVISALNIKIGEATSTDFILQAAGQLDDYVIIMNPKTNFSNYYINPTHKQLLYRLENQQLNFDFFTGVSYVKVDILGGIKNTVQTSRTVQMVFQNPQTLLGANETQIAQATQKGIYINSIGNTYTIDDSKWFYGSVLGCEIASTNDNQRNIGVKNHLEVLNSSVVNAYYGSIDLITLNNTILILINNGTIIQLNSNMTFIKQIQLNVSLIDERLPYKLVPMMREDDKVIVVMKNRDSEISDFTMVIVSGVISGSNFTVESNAIQFEGKYDEIFQIMVYNSTFVFIGWGAVPRLSTELGFISVYQLNMAPNLPNPKELYMDFIRDFDSKYFAQIDLSISSFHLEDGLYNNQAQLLFVLDDRGKWFNYVILNLTNLSSTTGDLTSVPLSFTDTLRKNMLYYDQETVFFGLKSVGQTALDAENLNVTFLITTSNTAIYEMSFAFSYKTQLQPTIIAKVIYNNYGPNYRVRQPAVPLGSFILVDFISVDKKVNRTDFLAIYDQSRVSKPLQGGASLVQFSGTIIKGTNPFNIDLFSMVYNQNQETVNIVFQDTNITPDSQDETRNTLFAAIYHENITLLAYADRFPAQKIYLQFKSFYSSPESVAFTFLSPTPDPSSSSGQSSDDKKKDNLEVLWILLGTFGGLLILAAAYILIKRRLLIQRDQGEIAADEENYQRLN